MDLISAIILGIVEGLTEYAPVSSTGHLIITGKLLGFEGELVKTFEIFIQLGAILAVLVLYREKWLLLFDLKRTGGLNGRDGILKLFFACVPFVILGGLFHKQIKQHLFTSTVVAIGLILGGAALIIIERLKLTPKTREIDSLSIKQSLIIGLFQCFALCPGFSRSASTIVGGMFAGLPRAVSAEFSFLIAVPIMFLVVGGDLIKSYSLIGSAEIPTFLTGFIVSFLIAYLTIGALIKFLSKNALTIFGWYRIALGLIVLLFFA